MGLTLEKYPQIEEPGKRSAVLRYSAAVLAFSCSCLSRIALAPVLGTASPFITFFPAIVASAGFGGLGPGLLTTGISGIWVLYFLLRPANGIRAGMLADQVGLVLFLAIGVVISWLNHALRDSRNRARAELAGRKTSERALDELKEQFSIFMEHLPAAAFIKDTEGHYLWGNSTWRKRFSEGTGRPEGKTDFELWPHEVAAAFVASDRKILDSRSPLQLVESGIVEGCHHFWLVSKFPVVRPGGQLLIGGLSLDITETRRLEEQLSQAQKVEALGLLAGGVAHDFNNLLMVIIGSAGLVRDALGGTSEALIHLESIETAAEQAAAVTRQLLAFGRRQLLLPQLLDVNSAVSETAKLLRRVVRENIEIRLVLAPDLGQVKVDPGQLQQVILNLAINARDAMAEGGRLTIETQNVELDRDYTIRRVPVLPGPYVMLVVADDGIGMDARTQEKIFDPFFTTKGIGHGTGLGLSSVYGIVKQSGGYIWVYSELDHGTTFKVYLPRVNEVESRPVRLQGGPIGRAERIAGSVTVLIVEDEQMLLRLISGACARAGFRVLEASNGTEALAACETFSGRIDLMVTDLVMPGMNGRELAQRLKALRPETKVIFCSGYTEHSSLQNGFVEEDIVFLEKPFSADALLKKIDQIIGD